MPRSRYALSAATVLSASMVAAQIPMQTVVLSGDAAPGAEPAVVFGDPLTGEAFHDIRLNGNGEVAFFGRLNGPSVNEDNRYGWWAGPAGGIEKLLRFGDPAPGSPFGATFLGTSDTSRFNDQGQLAFVGHLTSGDNPGIWSGSTGALGRVAMPGDDAPGMPLGTRFSHFNNTITGPVGLNNGGQLAFRGYVEGPGITAGVDDAAIWRGVPGSLEVVARAGQPAPGAPTNRFFGGFEELALGASGSVAFGGYLASSTGPVNRRGLWAGQPGLVGKLALTGEAAPGTPAGVRFAALDEARINASGVVAFQGVLQGVGVDSENQTGIWAGTPGAVSRVARAGDQAPGLPAGVRLTGVFGPSAIDDTGRVTFCGYTSAGTPEVPGFGFGYWIGTQAGLTKIMHSGDAAPGTPAGVTFAQSFGGPEIITNNSGQVAFGAALSGPGVDSLNNRGIWATTLDHELLKIVRIGDLLDVNSDPLIDEYRTIAYVEIGGLNDAGQLALSLTFADGSSGVFIATIPEPQAALAYGLPAALAALLRRRGPAGCDRRHTA